MRSGALKHLITIERPVTATDDNGDDTTTWVPVAPFIRIMAEVLPDRATEFFSARQVQATQNAMIRLYYQPGIDETMRVRQFMRPGLEIVWDIQGSVPFQSNQMELRLYCLQRMAEGYRRGGDLLNIPAPTDPTDPDPGVDPDPDSVTSDSTLITSDDSTITADAA